MNILSPQIEQSLKKESLRYIRDTVPGFFRQKLDDKFSYYDSQGRKITEKAELDRIKHLTIPPAWQKVWISPLANTHLQVTGFDEKKRKQYIYHEDWKKLAQENKFSKMTDFALALPKIRRRISYDLKLSGMDKRKILATIVWLLEHTFIRIGNEEYSRENNSYGLTTLRDKHVQIRGNDVRFHFRGKSGVEHQLEITHPTVSRIIKKCIELPGYELFQYIDDHGKKHAIDSQDVNDFLKEIAHDDFSAKDFRTWGGSNIASTHLYKIGPYRNKTHLKKALSQTCRTVSEYLGNTVAVCKSYYIHPAIFKSYETNSLIPYFGEYRDKKVDISGLSWEEMALLDLLRNKLSNRLSANNIST